MEDRPLHDKLDELYALVETLSKRIHDLEHPNNVATLKPCHHFSDLVIALDAINELASTARDETTLSMGAALDTIHRLANSTLKSKYGRSCPRWKYTFDPNGT